MTANDEARRQVLYWRLLGRLFDPEEQATLETASLAVIDDIGLPAALLDPSVSVDTVVQRFPELAGEFESLLLTPPDPELDDRTEPGAETGPGTMPRAAAGPDTTPGAEAGKDTDAEPGGTPATEGGAGPGAVPAVGDDAGADAAAGDDAQQVRRAALVSKVLLNVFATGTGNVSATQLAQWQQDADWFRKCMGGGGPGGSSGGSGPGRGDGPGNGFEAVLGELEGDLVKRMRLREVLADPQLARQLKPSMSLIEQLLRDKHNLSGVALANAKSLIKRFVDEVAEVLRTQVEKTSTGQLDRSVPPKRVYRNLDLERTIWKNLTNWSPQDEKLYVDKLFYRHTAKRTTPARLIVVVDQSGSMVDAMVNCTILASIFAGLPKVDVHLVAYDTRAMDLTPWVHDPFEVLLRTQLGGGTDGTVAMALARPKIADPRNTVLVWISDFYDNELLIHDFTAIHRSGAKFIPVGSVNSSGHASVNPWFKQRLKDLGTPVISGHIRKLVLELKTFLA